jgi:hypothetical protein
MALDYQLVCQLARTPAVRRISTTIRSPILAIPCFYLNESVLNCYTFSCLFITIIETPGQIRAGSLFSDLP